MLPAPDADVARVKKNPASSSPPDQLAAGLSFPPSLHNYAFCIHVHDDCSFILNSKLSATGRKAPHNRRRNDIRLRRSGVGLTFCRDVSRSRSSDPPNNRNTP